MTIAMASGDLWRDDEERWVERRQQFLRRQYGLRQSVAEVLAWHEIGYSSSGCAKRADTTESTVRGFFDEVEEQYGLAAVLVKRADELGIDAPLVPEGSR